MFNNGGFEADLYDGSFHPQGSHQHHHHAAQAKQHQQHQLHSAVPAAKRFSVWGFRGFNPGADAAAVLKHDCAESTACRTSDDVDPGKLRACVRRFAAIMLSQLGTFVIVICYIIMGGFLFQYLEVENEISNCQTKYDKFLSKRNEAVDRIYNMAQNGKNATVAKSAIFSEIGDFAKDIFTLSMDPRLNCSTLGQESIPNWNFANAAYFCVTIITTIGYGHISPGTSWGQIVCMIYAILGIPLMLLFLTKIGEPTALLFKAFYLNICCCKCFVKRKLAEERATDESIKQQQQHQQQQTSWATAENGQKMPPAKVKDMIVVEEDVDDDDDDEEEDIVNIPISVTIMLLILYILLGASVFRIWESWSMVEGTYFSFITLATIGFGDYVPGKDGPFNSKAVITELLIGALYCFFGLTVLSMCINLIQDEISAKFHWIGIKLGMSRPEEPEQDTEESDSDENDTDGESSGAETADHDDARSDRAATSRRQLKPPPPPTALAQLSQPSHSSAARKSSGRHILFDGSSFA